MLQLKNGIRVLVKPMQGLMSVSVGVMVGVGSAYETEKESGISHYIEHMMFKGTKNRSALAISEYVDDFGGQINAFTSKNTTCYYVKCTAEHVSRAFNVLADMLQNSLFSEEEQKKEKGVILEEIHMGEDTPDELCLDLSALAIFGANGYGKPIIGTEENVKRFNREEIQAFMAKHYTPQNVVISVTGNVNEKEIYAMAEEFFGEWTARPYHLPAPKIIYQKGTEYKSKRIEQTHLSFDFPSYAYEHENANALTLASAVLGGSMSSRLFQKIREELGLAYSVYTMRSSYLGGGDICVYAGVNPERSQEASAAIACLLSDFSKRGITNSEFARAKEQMKASFVFSQDNVATQMLVLGKHALLTGETYDLEGKLAEMNAVTLDGVNSTVAEIFNPEKLAVSAVFKEGKESDVRAAFLNAIK
ncbi:MAG: insulinase family protein [Clostridiales bacterium]|nr:insulinase family protein [Clostridiales bacterium]